MPGVSKLAMNSQKESKSENHSLRAFTVFVGMMIIMLACPFNVFSNSPVKPHRPERRTTSPISSEWPDTINVEGATTMLPEPSYVEGDAFYTAGDSIIFARPDSVPVAPAQGVRIFNPDPTRAVWLSALFPGLGQLYNRRFWKLPIIIGGYMGLGYATSWNNGMLRDYTRAYADIMDNDPSTNSYMDFFPPTTSEADLNRTWLQNVLKSRKDYYRRNRDLCIICMVGVYLLAIVDAYVDASLSHFDISPSLSMDLTPTLIPELPDARRPGIGMQWALNF